MLGTSKVPKLHYYHQKQKKRKKPLKFSQEKTSSPLENSGDLKKKSLQIFLNSKLSNLILHLKPGTQVRGDS
jgi:hypothetical protein